MDELHLYDIVQIKPGSGVSAPFEGKLAVVDEVRFWGCVAYVETFEGKAYIRLKSDQYEKVGALAWIRLENP